MTSLVPVGIRGGGECARPSIGDLFSFYGGNPVVVEEGKPTNVGLAMSTVARPPDPSGKRGIEGFVYDDQGEPIYGAVVYFYRSPEGEFRGIPDYFTRTSKEGKFRARIGKGRYYILVRKRKSGDVFGPTMVGDYFGFYPGNPLEYDGTSSIAIRIDCVPRLSQLEKFEGFEPVKHGISVSGIVLDVDGEPVQGYYVFAYRGDREKGMPDAISVKTDGKGHFTLTLYAPGPYRLVARARPGGPAEDKARGKVEVEVVEKRDLEGVVITLEGKTK